MNKVETAWVIQRDDGLFFNGFNCFTDKEIFKNDIIQSIYIMKKYVSGCHYSIENVRGLIKDLNLQNCKPIKIELRVVEE